MSCDLTNEAGAEVRTSTPPSLVGHSPFEGLLLRRRTHGCVFLCEGLCLFFWGVWGKGNTKGKLLTLGLGALPHHGQVISLKDVLSEAFRPKALSAGFRWPLGSRGSSFGPLTPCSVSN